MTRFIIGFVAGILLMFAGAGLARTARPAPAQASPAGGIYSDVCIYDVKDISYYVNLPYGSAKYVEAVVANWDGAYLTDYAARNAVSSFECTQYGF
ncbi:MAG TPA: hypothetical protein VFC53_01985 [Dehalococcoidia bacterium]|nr:hypothetical protein [Dehalococcoidia bacterium]